MIKRKLAAAEIKRRIGAVKTELGIVSFRQNVTTSLSLKELDAVLYHEREDRIIKSHAKGYSIFPVIRELEIVVELIAVQKPEAADLYEKYVILRNAVMSDIHPVVIGGKVDTTTVLTEKGSFGPYGFGLNEVEAIQIILGLQYVDKGTMIGEI